ncbi:MAG TPA: hypothetical protein VEX43_02055 [Chthoniobacterales bacterium]|nr:hypothetical protein [Chthoniobacterales bacterium]
MRGLIYALQFIRPAGSNPAGEPTLAASVRITTAITTEGVSGEVETLDEYQTAVMQNTAVVNPDGKTFTESGTITFGDPAEGNRLHFSSIGVGYIDVYPCPEPPYTAGTVMWKVDAGEGFFAGATGAITSNFLIDLSKQGDEGELIDHHFGVIYLP